MSQNLVKQYHMHFVGGERIVLKDELVYAESYGRKVHFQMINGRYVAYRKLDEVERELADHDFLRIHQSYLVNMNFTTRFTVQRMNLTKCLKAGKQTRVLPF